MWILVLASFIVPLLPLIPVVGYLLRVIDASDRDDPAPPLRVDVRTLLRRGVGGSALSFVFLAGPFVTLLITVYGAVFGLENVDPGGSSRLIVYAGSTVVLMLALVGAYLLPIALFRYARTGSLRAAFERKWHWGAATHAAYFAGWTLGAAIAFVGLGIGTALLSVSRVGPLLAALVFAYSAFVAFHVWGRTLARVH